MVTEPPRVLVAEDDAALRNLFAELLRDEFGAAVDVVPDGRAAIVALASRTYALVVLDLLMPVADGFAVLRWLASRPPTARVPVIACTGVHDSHRQHAMLLGAATCLVKPFELDDLVAAARPHLPPRKP
jgi:CheY-like chemotaxis protein